MGIIAFLFYLCLCLAPCCAQAASTLDAAEFISPEKDCSLILSYRDDGAALKDVPVKLYRIADVSADFQYSLTSPFAASGLVLNGIQTVGEWNVIRSTLETYILANDIEETLSSVTDRTGCARFEGLKPGLYLAGAVHGEQCSFDSALIALPGLDEKGLWQYQLTASPKPVEKPPVEPDEEIGFKVLKLWKGDSALSDRPQSIEVEIFRNGTSDRIVTLSKENNWVYSWTAKKDGASWKVAERNVPEGYTVTVEERPTAFILTNTLSADEPENPENPPEVSPETGDTSNIMLYTVLMYVSGIVLVLLGIAGKRKCK